MCEYVLVCVCVVVVVAVVCLGVHSCGLLVLYVGCYVWWVAVCEKATMIILETLCIWW